jgi:hypothetical protein
LHAGIIGETDRRDNRPPTPVLTKGSELDTSSGVPLKPGSPGARTDSRRHYKEVNMGGSSMIARIVTWIILGVLAILAFKVALGILGFVLGLAGFVLFVVAPLVVLGWLATRAWQAFTRPAD